MVGTKNPVRYVVYLSPDFYLRLSARQFTHEWILVQAFQYLLEQEKYPAIPKTFNLEDLVADLPEFETTIKERLSSH